MHEIILVAAKYLYLVIALTAFAYWLTVPKREKLRLMVFAIIAAISTFALAKLGSVLYYDPRPFVTHAVIPIYPHGADNGFPSDHTLLTAFIALVIFSSSRRLGALLLVLAALVGISRVIGYIHSPIDIIGSFVFAIAGFGIAAWATPRMLKKVSSNAVA